MKYFSMFSGIGGFELGIEKAGEYLQRAERRDIRHNGCFANPPCRNNKQSETRGDREFQQPKNIGFSEIDKYAIQIYKKHYPDHINYGDATKIDTSRLPDFDLLVGGFPCQSFSVAGKRKGFDDTRGTLFFEIARVLRDKRPRYPLLENVKGLLSHDNGKTFQTILGVLADLGYSVEWQVLNSKNFGVPQNRERVFIIGHLGDGPRPKVFPLRQSSSGDIETQGTSRGNGTRVRGNYPHLRVGGRNNKALVAEALQEREYKRGQLINQLNDPTHSNDRIYGDDGIGPALNTMQGGRRQPKVAIPCLTPDRMTKRQHGRRFKDDGEPSFTLTGSDLHGVMTSKSRIRRLTPMECERLQGFPDQWTKEGLDEKGNIVEISDTQRYKCLGNAVTTNVVQQIMESLINHMEDLK